MRCDIIILGGGAAGLAACAKLAASGKAIALIERNDRVGKKIMAAGNGRCNISNTDMSPARYGDAADFVARVYEKTPPEEVLSFFSDLGLMTVVEEGRIYPRTMMAASVLDVLRAACERENVTLLSGQQVVSLAPSRRGGWCAQLKSGEGIFAPQVLCALGGSAAPNMGTDGSSTKLMAQLGHAITALHPALVQLRCDHGALRSLKGVRVQARLTLDVGGAPTASEEGELLFADYGVSGVCVFQLSALASRALADKQRVTLLVHLLPEVEDVPAWLRARIAARGQISAQQLFTGAFPRLLAQAILKQAGVSPEAAVSRLSERQIAALSDAIAAFPLPVTGTQGFAHAQVTAGGVAREEVEPGTMASRLFPGLYLAGEVLDVHGPCGGYNLHFAFASGLTAAKAMV